ncbi:MAG: hypothetical protein NTU81_01255 [Candidatus Nomurabacteria bacterium]|nr:hypothetical protein [Candidatus Nomurabacteria bacterium]
MKKTVGTTYLFVFVLWLLLITVTLNLPFNYSDIVWGVYSVLLVAGVALRKSYKPSVFMFILAALTPVVELARGLINGINLFDQDKEFYCFDFYGISSYIIFAILIPTYIYGISKY